MHFGRLLGWILLIGAFVFAAADVAAQGVAGEFGILGAVDLLDILAPDFLDRLIIAVRDGIHPFAWDPVLVTLMALPGWLLAGVPGVALAWHFRLQPIGGDEDDDLPYNTYEGIVVAAKEEAAYQSQEPSKYKDLHEYDPTDALDEPEGYGTSNMLPPNASDIANFQNNDWPESVAEQVGSSFDQEFEVLPLELDNIDIPDDNDWAVEAGPAEEDEEPPAKPDSPA